MNLINRKIMAGILALALAACGLTGVQAREVKPAAGENVNNKDGVIIPKGAEYVEGEAIVLYSSDVTKGNAKRSLKKDADNIKVTDMYHFGYGTGSDMRKMSLSGVNNAGGNTGFSVGVVKSDEFSTEELIKKLNMTAGVERACPNYIVHADSVDETDVTAVPLKKFQWALNNDGSDGGKEGCDINREAVKIRDTSEKVVAVIDSGIDYEHEDLKDAMWVNPFGESTLKGKHGYDFINKDDDPMDDYNHGTHCAGIIAGTGGSGYGIEGVAKDTGTKLMALKTLGAGGSGSSSYSIAAYDYVYRAVSLGVNVVAVNNSFGIFADENYMYINKRIFDSLGKLGVINVCAAGNDASDLAYMDYAPVNVDSDYVVGVAAAEPDDSMASYSNYGSSHTHIAAPGTSILSTIAGSSYTPWCYGEEKYNETTAFVEKYESEDAVSAVEVSNSNRMKTEWVSDGGTGAAGNATGCLKVHINAAAGAKYYVYLNRYETEQSDEPVYASADIRFEGTYIGALAMYIDGMQEPDGSIDVYDYNSISMTYSKEDNKAWGKMSGDITHSQKAGEKHVMAFCVNAWEKGEYTLYIDNVTRSKPNLSAETIGKYAYFKGTSMSCPYVAGAVALLAAGYPSDSVPARRNRLLGCVRKTDELAEKVRTGGTLDMTNCDNPPAWIAGAEINGDGTVTVNGYALGDTKLFINEKEAVIKEQDDEHITVEAGEYANRAVMLAIEKDGEKADELLVHLAAGDKLNDESRIKEFEFDNGIFLPDEKSGAIYYVSQNLSIQSGNLDMINLSYLNNGDINLIGMGDSLSDYMAASTIYMEHTYPVLVDGTIYAVVLVDNYFEKYKILVAFDWENNMWKYVCRLPEAFMEADGIALEEYNGSIYFIGGFDTEKKEAVSDVCRYDMATGNVESVPSLPEKRAFSRTAVHGGKLYVTLGGGDSEGIRCFIYDGEKWTVSGAVINDNVTASSYEYEDGGSFMYHYGEVHSVKDGLIYITDGTDGMSSPFMYDAAGDSYKNMDWCFNGRQYERWNTFIMGNKLYIVSDIDGSYWERGAGVFSIPVEREMSSGAESQAPAPAVSSEPAQGFVTAPVAEAAPGADSPANAADVTVAVKKPAKVKLKSAALKKKKLSVKWNKVKKADGYVIQASENSKFSKTKKTWQTKKNQIKNKSWNKKKCYIRVRAFVKRGGVYIYGKWSSVKKV